jgi:hypothetical protein
MVEMAVSPAWLARLRTALGAYGVASVEPVRKDSSGPVASLIAIIFVQQNADRRKWYLMVSSSAKSSRRRVAIYLRESNSAEAG